MVPRSILATFLTLFLLQNAYARSDDWSTNIGFLDSSIATDTPVDLNTRGLGPIIDTSLSYNDNAHAVELPPLPPGVTEQEWQIAPVMNRQASYEAPPLPPGCAIQPMQEVTMQEMAQGAAENEYTAPELPLLQPGYITRQADGTETPPVPLELAQQIARNTIETQIAEEKLPPLPEELKQQMVQNAVTEYKAPELPPPLQPGYITTQADGTETPPVPLELAQQIARNAIETQIAEEKLPPLPEELKQQMVQNAVTEYKAPEVLPLPPDFKEVPLQATPAIHGQAAEATMAEIPPEFNEQQPPIKDEAKAPPVAEVESPGLFSIASSIFTNLLERGLEAKQKELDSLEKTKGPPVVPTTTDVPASAVAPAHTLDPDLTAELNRLVNDARGKDYYPDLTNIVQIIKTDPDSFATNTALQAKFDSIIEKAAGDEATTSSTNNPTHTLQPLQNAAVANPGPSTIAMPETPVQSHAAIAPSAAGTDEQISLDFTGLPVEAEIPRPNYVEDWNKIEGAGLAAQEAPRDSVDIAIPAATDEPLETLKTELANLKGTRYEQDAQKILTQIQTNAPPEQYSADLKALIAKIDTQSAGQAQDAAHIYAQMQTNAPPQQYESKLNLLIQEANSGDIPEPLFFKTPFSPGISAPMDSQSRQNRVDRATPPRIGQ